MEALSKFVGQKGIVNSIVQRIKSTANASSMSIGPAEVDPGWQSMKTHVKDIRVSGLRNPEAVDRVLSIFERQIARWVGNARELADLHELLAVIRLNAFSITQDNQHLWVFDLTSNGSSANMALVTLVVESSGQNGVSVQWKTIDSNMVVAPTTRLVQHCKSSMLRSKSWSELMIIPRNTSQNDIMALLGIVGAVSEVAAT